MRTRLLDSEAKKLKVESHAGTRIDGTPKIVGHPRISDSPLEVKILNGVLAELLGVAPEYFVIRCDFSPQQPECLSSPGVSYTSFSGKHFPIAAHSFQCTVNSCVCGRASSKDTLAEVTAVRRDPCGSAISHPSRQHTLCSQILRECLVSHVLWASSIR